MKKACQLILCVAAFRMFAVGAADIIADFLPGTVRAKFADKSGRVYLRLTGDPAERNNSFRFTACPLPNVKGGEVVNYTAECKVEALTAGSFEIGVYEFADPEGRNVVRFQLEKVPAVSGWQKIVRTLKLRNDTRLAKFYVIARRTGKGDAMTVRALNVEIAAPTAANNVLGFEPGSAETRFVTGDGQKLLHLAGDPARKHNNFRFNFYRIPDIRGGELVTYTVSAKLERLSAGKLRIGVYEFSDAGARNAIRFQSQSVEPAPGWRNITGTVRLKPEARAARLYVLAQGLTRDDAILVRAVEVHSSSPAAGGLVGDFLWPEAVRAEFIDCDGGIALRITGDPAAGNNAFRFAYCPLEGVKGGDELTFTAECLVPSVTPPGVVHIGIYEFADAEARKVIRFQPVRVNAGSGWQTVSKQVRLTPETKSARFYIVGRNLARGETILVRKAVIRKH